MDMIRVSVIIPVYNVSSYLRRCLDSVLAQTLKDIEVICVDDASTDDSPKILQEYAAKDARVKVVRQENAGAGAARNRGLDLAQGEYLSFLDSDDFFEPDMLEKAYALAKRDMDDIVVFGSDQFRQKENARGDSDDGTFVSVDWTIRRNNLPSSRPFSYRELTGNVFKTFVGWAWDKLFRHQFITDHNIRYQVQRTTNDMLFVYTALVLAERISILDEVMVHQRRDSRDSLSKTRENSWHCFHDALIELKNRLIQEGIYAKLTKDYINYSLHFTLWNYNSLAEPTKSMLREKLLNEWFDEFGISGKDRYYFENQKEYDQYLDILYGTEGAGSKAGKSGGKKAEKEDKDLLHMVSSKLYFPRKLNYIIEQQKELRTLVRELHRDNAALRKRLNELDEKQQQMGERLTEEFRRRDEWPKIRAQMEREAAGRPVWVIKCPAPDNETKLRWGDYPFAMSLKKNLEKLGFFVIVDFKENWAYEEWADVVVALRGSSFYRPDRRNKKTVYILWNISHPDWVTDYEYELFDIVCVGSKHYAAQLSERLTVPVYPLLQCTDTDIFYPASEETEKTFDYIFLGNSRGVARPCVMWAIDEKLPLRMWGSGWNVILQGHMDLIEAPMIENAKIPALYRASRVALNDHWSDMLEKQFINNRIFDVLACGLPVISDTFDELKDLFPDAVLHYTTRAQFHDCVEQLRTDYESVRAKVDAQWPLISREFSFERRAQQLAEMAGNFLR